MGLDRPFKMSALPARCQYFRASGRNREPAPRGASSRVAAGPRRRLDKGLETGPMQELDAAVFHAVNATHTDGLDLLMVLASARWLGVTICVSLVPLLLWRRRAAAFRVIGCGALAVALADTVGARLIKPLVGRVRPCFALPPGSFRQLVEVANVGSMPSLHAANAFAVATVLVLSNRRLVWVAFPVAALVAVSRVYVGVHWPSDVVLGAVWGTSAATLMWGLTRSIAGRLALAKRASDTTTGAEPARPPTRGG